jgi:hypothetical protein
MDDAISRVSAFLADPQHQPAHKPFAAVLGAIQAFIDDAAHKDDSGRFCSALVTVLALNAATGERSSLCLPETTPKALKLSPGSAALYEETKDEEEARKAETQSREAGTKDTAGLRVDTETKDEDIFQIIAQVEARDELEAARSVAAKKRVNPDGSKERMTILHKSTPKPETARWVSKKKKQVVPMGAFEEQRLSSQDFSNEANLQVAGLGSTDTFDVPGMASPKGLGMVPSAQELEKRKNSRLRSNQYQQAQQEIAKKESTTKYSILAPRGLGTRSGSLTRRIMKKKESMLEEIDKQRNAKRMQRTGSTSSLIGVSLRGGVSMLQDFSVRSVFKPENPKRMLWDMYMMVLILYYAFAVPLRIGFSQDPKHPLLEHFFTGCFGLDILINFNTALIGQGGTLVTDRQLIAKDYLRAWFWIDFVGKWCIMSL